MVAEGGGAAAAVGTADLAEEVGAGGRRVGAHAAAAGAGHDGIYLMNR